MLIRLKVRHVLRLSPQRSGLKAFFYSGGSNLGFLTMAQAAAARGRHGGRAGEGSLAGTGIWMATPLPGILSVIKAVLLLKFLPRGTSIYPSSSGPNNSIKVH